MSIDIAAFILAFFAMLFGCFDTHHKWPWWSFIPGGISLGVIWLVLRAFVA